MNLNETIIRCDKCKEINTLHHTNKSSNNNDESCLNNSSEDDLMSEHHHQQQQKTTPNSSHKKPKCRIAIAKCLDCNLTYCSDCLLEHQLDNLDSSHKLIHLNENLTSSNNAVLKEINNNSKKEINQNELNSHSSSNKSSPSYSPKNQKSFAQNQMANILNSIHFDDMNNSNQTSSSLFNDVSLIKRRLNNNNNNDSCEDISSATSLMANTLSNITNKLQQQQQQSNNNNNQSSTLFKYQQLQKQQMYQKQMQLHQIKQSTSSNPILSSSSSSNQSNNNNNMSNSTSTNSNNSNSTGHEANKLIQIETEIQKTYNFYLQTLKERKDYLIKELNTITQYALINHTQNINKQIQIQYQLELKKQQLEKEIENEVNDLKLILSPNKTSIVNEENNNPQTVADLTTLNTKLTNLNELNNLILINNQLIAQLKANNPLNSIEFISNFSAIQTSIRNTFGYIRINKYDSAQNLTSNSSLNGGSTSSNGSNNNLGQLTISCNNNASSSSASAPITALSSTNNNSNNELPSNLLFSKISNLAASTTSSSGVSSMFSSNDNLCITSPVSSKKQQQHDNSENDNEYSNYLLGKNHQNEETLSENNKITLSASSTGSSKSSKSNSSLSSSNSINISQLVNSAGGIISAASGSNTCYPRSKMIYHCKFGEFGINDGQFTEPSGVTINTNNDIIVADTNSHRIQIFDKDGRFKFKFGECGKRDGQLLYPNRVSIIKQTGDIVVTERSPTHQIQIYNKYGQFLRKFGANILQHPRGVCVDYKGRIIVVECKVMRVIIFDVYGNVLQKFNCSKYLEFPNGVCCSNPLNNPANPREEIYISDNRAHCIKVFDYNGNFIRQIGCEGLTNYPIGVGINSNNEILVADNHNNFNLTVFTQDGKLINALESKVKHAQCFDVGLMDDGSIVLASKDYRIYVYKYVTNSSHQLTASNSSSNLLQQTTNSNSNGLNTNKMSEDDLDLNVYNNNQDQKVIDSFDLFGGHHQTIGSNLLDAANYELNEKENNEAAANLLLSSLASQIGLI